MHAGAMAASPVLRNGWSAESLLAAVAAMDQDAGLADSLQLPDDPQELAALVEAWFLSSLNTCCYR